MLERRIHRPWLVLIPTVYIVTDLPALLLGASPRELLSVYLTQTGTYKELTLSAPNLHQFLTALPDTETAVVATTAFAGIAVLALIGAALTSRAELTAARILLATAVSVVLPPYLLRRCTSATSIWPAPCAWSPPSTCPVGSSTCPLPTSSPPGSPTRSLTLDRGGRSGWRASSGSAVRPEVPRGVPAPGPAAVCGSGVIRPPARVPSPGARQIRA